MLLVVLLLQWCSWRVLAPISFFATGIYQRRVGQRQDHNNMLDVGQTTLSKCTKTVYDGSFGAPL